MRLAMLASVLLIAATSAAVDPKNEPMPTPLMRTVEPYFAKVGTEVTITGDHLGKNLVTEVYLNATGDDRKVKVDLIEQSDTQLKFKVPDVRPGAYKVLVLLRSIEPIIIEEPVRLVIEE